MWLLKGRVFFQEQQTAERYFLAFSSEVAHCWYVQLTMQVETRSKTTFEEHAKLAHKPLDKPHTICDTAPTGKRRRKRASDC